MREADTRPSISRRDFLRRATIATAAATVAIAVGPEILEAFERLGPRRLLVPGQVFGISAATFPEWSSRVDASGRFTMEMLQRVITKIYDAPGYVIPHTLTLSEEEFDAWNQGHTPRVQARRAALRI